MKSVACMQSLAGPFVADHLSDFLLSQELGWWVPYVVRESWANFAFKRAFAHGCACILCGALDFVRSPKHCADLAQVWEVSGLTPTTTYATRLDRGDELGTHTDEGNGDVALVWNLSKNWTPSYGGDLVIGDVDLSPVFDSVVLFDVSGKGRAHSVTPVTVDKPRLAISGWYRVTQ